MDTTRSIELRSDIDTSSPSKLAPWSSPEKHQCPRRILVGLAASFFIVGAVCGYLIPSRHHSTGRFEATEGVTSCQAEGSSDLKSEMEAGLDVVLKWFPEQATRIRQHRLDIVNHIVSLTEPRPDSILRRLTLGSFWKRRRSSNSTGVVSRRLWRRNHSIPAPQRRNHSTVERRTGREVETWENATNCTLTVAEFVSHVLEFLTGFVRFRIPDKHAFHVALLMWIGEMNTHFKYFKSTVLYQKIVAFTFERNARRKAEAIWAMLKDAWDYGGGWLRFVFDYVVENGHDPWQILKFCIKFAARLVMWITKGKAAFAGGVTFQLLNAKDMFSAGLKVMSTCNSTEVDLPADDENLGSRVELVERYCELRATSSVEDIREMADLISSDLKVLYHKALSFGCNSYCDDGTCADGGIEKYYEECPPLEEVPGTREVIDDGSGNVTIMSKVKISLGFIGTRHSAKAIFSTTSKNCKSGVPLCIDRIELGKVWTKDCPPDGVSRL